MGPIGSLEPVSRCQAVTKEDDARTCGAALCARRLRHRRGNGLDTGSAAIEPGWPQPAAATRQRVPRERRMFIMRDYLYPGGRLFDRSRFVDASVSACGRLERPGFAKELWNRALDVWTTDADVRHSDPGDLASSAIGSNCRASQIGTMRSRPVEYTSRGHRNAAIDRRRVRTPHSNAGTALKRLTFSLPLLRGSLTREDELAVRASLADAWLLQDDLVQAASALGRPPDALRDAISDAQLSTLWRLHGRITFARGEQSRAIALHSRALKHAELAHDSRAIGLAHYELALCYKQVGDSGIFRDHLTEAAAALHAAGDRRHLALVHSLSAILLAQSGRTARGDSPRCVRASAWRWRFKPTTPSHSSCTTRQTSR